MFLTLFSNVKQSWEIFKNMAFSQYLHFFTYSPPQDLYEITLIASVPTVFLLLHTNTAVVHFQAELSDFSYYFTDANCLSALIHIGAKIYMKISHERF